MPKLKMARQSTNVDMTAMCDVAFLLLTFFMLATKFKPDEPVVVSTPSSISEIPLPDTDIMLLTVDSKGRIFFSMDNQEKRMQLIQNMNDYKDLKLTSADMQAFKYGSSIGAPFNQLKSYLNASPADQNEYDKTTGGIPVDTSNDVPGNELAAWIYTARNTNPKLRICIKADSKASYPQVKDVIRTLENYKIYKFNLITDLKAVPAGTAAAKERENAS